MGVRERLCLASRNIGDRGATLGSMGDKVGDIIVCVVSREVSKGAFSLCQPLQH